jgi:hypothetical protein
VSIRVGIVGTGFALLVEAILRSHQTGGWVSVAQG